MIGKTGGELVSIPLPQIQIPEFRYGTKNSGGVGQGPGDVGTPIGRSGASPPGTTNYHDAGRHRPRSFKKACIVPGTPYLTPKPSMVSSEL